MKKTPLKAACHAHTDLNTFHAVIDIMEGGYLYRRASKKSAAKIISICRSEAADCLREYDEAAALIAKGGADV